MENKRTYIEECFYPMCPHVVYGTFVWLMALLWLNIAESKNPDIHFVHQGSFLIAFCLKVLLREEKLPKWIDVFGNWMTATFVWSLFSMLCVMISHGWPFK